MATQINARNLLLSGARTADNVKSVSLSADKLAFTFDSAGALSPAGQVIAFTATRVRTTNPVVWSTVPSVTLYDSPTGGAATTSGNIVYLRAADFNPNLSVEVIATVTDGSVLRNSLNVLKQQAGSNGTNGTSVYTATVYLQSASAPTTPVATASTYNFSTSVLTPPAGWSVTQPATTTTPTYACDYTFSGTAGSTVTGTGSWSTPYIEAVNGTNGSNGEYRDVIQLYLQAGSVPTVPTSIPYTFSTNTLGTQTGGTAGWSLTRPASSTTPTYVITALAATTTPTVAVTLSTWTAPVIAAQNGSNGTNGTSVYTATVYLQSASAPTTPVATASTYNFSTSVLTPPAGWSVTQPATTTTPTYACDYTFSGTAGSTVTGTGSWSTPYIEAVNGTNGSNGEYRDVIQLYLQAGSVPTVPTSIPYTFSTNTLGTQTGGTAGWSLTRPASSTTPTYVITALAATTTPTVAVTLSTWTAPVIAAQNGSNGTNGTSVYTATVYLQSASAPTTPVATASTYNFSTSVLTPPAGWSVTQPATTTTPTYACDYTFSGTAGSTVTGTGSWSTPYIEAVNGTNGSNGEYRDVIQLYLQAGSVPTVPTSIPYTFSTNTLGTQTGGTAGWSLTRPASSTTPTYVITALAATTTPTVAVTLSTWTAPVIAAQNGSNGNPGDTAVFAYRVISSTTLPSAPSITQSTVPTAGAAATGTTWYLEPKATLAADEWMFQVSGTKTSGGAYTWQTLGYLSTFKVGSLSALTANMGTLTVDNTLTLNGTNSKIVSNGAVYGSSGIYLGWEPTTTAGYKFSIGSGLTYNGSTLTVGAITVDVRGRIGGIGSGNNTVVDVKYAEFQPLYSWDFTNSNEGWTKNTGDTLTPNTTYSTISTTGTDPIIFSPTISVPGSLYTIIRARIRRTQGTSWEGVVYFGTGSHDYSSNYYKVNPTDPTILNQWVVVEWDMTSLTVGGSDWINSTITKFRLDLGNTGVTDVFDIDWIQVGRVSPLPSQSNYFNNVITMSENGTLNNAGGGQVTIRGVGYTGDLDASADVSLAIPSTYTKNGNTITKNANAASGWNDSAHTTQFYTGGAYVEIQHDTNSSVMLGLVKTPSTGITFTSFNFAIYGAGTTVQAYIIGGVHSSGIKYPSGIASLPGGLNTLALKYEGSQVYFLVNGAVVWTETAPTGEKYSGIVSINEASKIVKSLRFLPVANTNNSRGSSLIDSSWWKVGASTNNWGVNQSGTDGSDNFITAALPDGTSGTVWQAVQSGVVGGSQSTYGTEAGGGWPAVSLDGSNTFYPQKNKTYMFVSYIKPVSGAGGQVYLGLTGNAVCNINTTDGTNTTSTNLVSNPYFGYINRDGILGEWILVVGYIFPAGTTTSPTTTAGIYNCKTGVKYTSGVVTANFTWAQTYAGPVSTRHIQYYASPNSVSQFVWPAVYLCDGSEPSLDDLLSMASISSRNPISSTNTATYIGANSITTNQITANAITAEKIFAGAVSAQHLSIAPKSLNLDPTFEGGAARWVGFVQRLARTNAAVPANCPVAFASQFNSRDNNSLAAIEVVPGEVYKASCWVNRGQGSGGSGIGIFGAVRGSDGGTVSSFLWPGTGTTATGWVRVTGLYTVPANSATLLFGPWADRSTYLGEAWYADLNIEKVNDASLIVDGAVTADKISTINLSVVNTSARGGRTGDTVGITLDAPNNAQGVSAGGRIIIRDGSNNMRVKIGYLI